MAVRLIENKYSIFNYDDKNIVGQIEEELYQNFREKFLATQINYEEFLGELFDFSLNKVDGFISSQKSAFFFFEILKFHESLTELNNKYPHQLHERYGLDNNFCAMSRKVLKVLLEGACDIELTPRCFKSSERMTWNFPMMSRVFRPGS